MLKSSILRFSACGAPPIGDILFFDSVLLLRHRCLKFFVYEGYPMASTSKLTLWVSRSHFFLATKVKTYRVGYLLFTGYFRLTTFKSGVFCSKIHSAVYIPIIQHQFFWEWPLMEKKLLDFKSDSHQGLESDSLCSQCKNTPCDDVCSKQKRWHKLGSRAPQEMFFAQNYPFCIKITLSLQK